jgi:peptidoglycan/LPS O-acetylase OafA/YrhL
MSSGKSQRAQAASLALGNLRAVLILIVLAFHSILAYLGTLPPTAYRFDEAPYRWQAFPMVDSHRFFGFDLFCAWQYVSMMALMFFLSGLFVAPSLERKGSWAFLSNRLFRIGLPLVIVISVVTPLAYYPTYHVSAADPSFAAFIDAWLALPFWPPGPQWFLSLLLGMNALAVLLHHFAPRLRDRLTSAVAAIAEHPRRLLLALLGAAAVAYVPLALVFSPWTWTNVGPIAFETTRALMYLVFFFAGYVIGAQGLGRGLLACDGPLARNWAWWLGAAVLGFCFWAGMSSMTLGDWDAVPLHVRLVAALSVVAACATGVLFPIAAALRFARRRRRMLDSLSANAYGMYLLHYAPVVWLQFALLDTALPAVIKAAIVFGVTLLISWPLAAAFGSLPLGTRPIGAKRIGSA